MALPTQPYKGTRDFYPEEMRIRRWMFDRLRSQVERFGYQEYDGPMLEPFELYAAKTGEEIVNQQLYWLMDRGERKLAVRPEMTPTLARMVAGRIHELPRPVRWYSVPNLWRYERPQRGRLREHWQLNVDVLGGDPLLADAEILVLALELIKSFRSDGFIKIQINNRRLVDHFFSNVLRLEPATALATIKTVDARAKIGEEAYFGRLSDFGISSDQQREMERFFRSSLDELAAVVPCPATDELLSLFRLLKESGVSSDQAVFDPSVMRGMDYYTGTVFEIYDVSPANRRAMFGGGRYDNLIALFGNQKLSGVGFGMGDVTLQNFLETHGLLPDLKPEMDVFVSLPDLGFRTEAEKVAARLRAEGWKVMTPLAVSGFGEQLRLASKHQARFAILFGDRERAEGKIILKDLSKGEQKALTLGDVLLELAQTKQE